MIPIVEYPSVVTSYLPAFESVFSRPQMRNFARYTSGLMISPNRTISAMNDLFYSHNDQSALDNFITDSPWSDKELDRARYQVILDGLKRRSRDCEGDGIFVMDDTLSHKTGKHMEYAGKFFDHAEGKYTHVHDIMTTHLVKGRLSVPLDFRVYIKKEEFEKEEDEEEEHPEEKFEDKNQMAREMLLKADSRGIPFLYVLGDSWFFCRETAELDQGNRRVPLIQREEEASSSVFFRQADSYSHNAQEYRSRISHFLQDPSPTESTAGLHLSSELPLKTLTLAGGLKRPKDGSWIPSGVLLG